VDTDHIDAALSELEKLLNDGLSSTLSSAGPVAADAGDNADGNAAVYNHAAAAVECTQIPRLTGQLSYARSDSLFIHGFIHPNWQTILTGSGKGTRGGGNSNV